jgi:hypothetical protein
VRALWRRAKAWLAAHGQELYTGYNLDFVAGKRLEEEALPGVKRIWYVNAEAEAERRVWMPQMNVYRQGYNDWTPFEPGKLDWLKRRFAPAGQTRVAEVDIYLFERKGN